MFKRRTRAGIRTSSAPIFELQFNELGRCVSRSMREVLELVVEFIRRHGVKVERRASALAMRPWWESENPAAS
jgi:hypothetical protein